MIPIAQTEKLINGDLQFFHKINKSAQIYQIFHPLNEK